MLLLRLLPVRPVRTISITMPIIILAVSIVCQGIGTGIVCMCISYWNLSWC